jgi:hypothetical protein
MNPWPELPYEAWKDTLQTLHTKLQIVGKVRLALTPFEPQWANVALYVNARGLTTSPMSYEDTILTVDVDLVDHAVIIQTIDGRTRRVALRARPVSEFYAEFMQNLDGLGIRPRFRAIPDEVPDRIPFAEDTVHSAYEPDWAHRFWTVLSRIDIVLKQHRSGFRGRTTPVHLFWGSLDLANTRYCGRDAEPRAEAGLLERLGGDAEQIAAGFWPGDEKFPEAAFFAYTYPKPDGIEAEPIRPASAAWNANQGEFILPYEEVRKSADPPKSILEFCASTYDAGARLRDWDPGLLAPPRP